MKQSPYQLLVRLDDPRHGSTRLAQQIGISGWYLAPPADLGMTEDSSVKVEVVVEEKFIHDSVTRHSIPLSGVSISKENSARGVSLNHFAHSAPPAAFNDGVRGVAYRVQGMLDLASVIPEDASSRIFSFALLVRMGSRVAVSNTVDISVASRCLWDMPYGGFLAPSVGWLASDYLALRGWAARKDDQLETVEIFCGEASFGEAVIHQQSPSVGALLPDIPQAENCIFAKSLRREEVFASQNRLSTLVSDLKARCVYRSGQEQELLLHSFRWLPDTSSNRLVDNWVVGEIERVFPVEAGKLVVEGWLTCSRRISPEFVIAFGSASIEAVSENDAAADRAVVLLRRLERSDVAQKYFAMPNFELNGFRLEIDVQGVGVSRKGVKVYLKFPDGSLQEFGPRPHWEGINRLVAEMRGEPVPAFDVVRTTSALTKECVDKVFTPLQNSLGKGRGVKQGRTSGESASEPKRILFAAHNLSDTEGAPKVLQRVIDHLHRKGPAAPEMIVVSPFDGGLRSSIEQLGIRVEVISGLEMFLQTMDRYQQSLSHVAQLVEDFNPDLIVCNVVDAFWGADISFRYRIPCVWMIHESVDPLDLFSEQDPQLQAVFLHRLAKAERIVFVAEQTRRLFLPHLQQVSTSVVPNGVDLNEISNWLKENSKSDARRRLGVGEEEAVVTIVGTTTERKGQDTFVEAMSLLKRDRGDLSFRFFVVGARKSNFLFRLQDMVEERGLKDEFVFVSETSQINDYFRATDVMAVCSRQESAPLVTLESFAYRTPLVSTKVFGLEEQIRDEINALAIEPDNPVQLADQVSRLLSDKNLCERLVAVALEDVEKRFSIEQNIPRYWQEFCQAIR